MIGSTALKMGNKSDPLTIPKSSLGKDSAIPVEILPDDHALITRFADDLLSEYLSAKRVGRDKVVFIVPVGPVGQYDLWADRCNMDTATWVPGVWGDPSTGAREKGESIVNAAVNGLVKIIRDYHSGSLEEKSVFRKEIL